MAHNPRGFQPGDGTLPRPGIAPGPGQRLRVRLSWRAYFLAFCEAHGGDPVPFEGKLLFRDGWTHSPTDHAGPEWPAPPDGSAELARLQRAYWSERRRLVARELVLLRWDVEQLRQMQRVRSAPLQQLVRQEAEPGPDGRTRVVTAAVRLDPRALAERVRWLDQDLADCDGELAKLEPKKEKAG